jgi:hypothetical protein
MHACAHTRTWVLWGRWRGLTGGVDVGQSSTLIRAAKGVVFENRMRMLTGPRAVCDALVVVFNNMLVLLREKEKDGHIAYRLLRPVRGSPVHPHIHTYMYT